MNNIKKTIKVEYVIEDTVKEVERAINKYQSGEDFRHNVIRAKKKHFFCLYALH